MLTVLAVHCSECSTGAWSHSWTLSGEAFWTTWSTTQRQHIRRQK